MKRLTQFFNFTIGLLLFLLLLNIFTTTTTAQVCSGNVVSNNLYRCISDNTNGYACDQNYSLSSACSGASCSGISYIADNCTQGVDVYLRTTCQAHNTAFGGSTSGCYWAATPPPPTNPPPTGGGGGGPTPTPGPPTALNPSGTVACPGTNPTNITFSWTAGTNASKYLLRIDDKSNGWVACQAPANAGTPPTPMPGDYCITTSALTKTQSLPVNKNYNWWVSSYDSTGTVQGGFSVTKSFTIPAICPTPTSSPSPSPSPTASPTPIPSCTVSLTPPGPYSYYNVGDTGTLKADVVTTNIISRVDFTKSGTSVNITPTSFASTPYTTNTSAVAAGDTDITARVFIGGIERCNKTITAHVITPSSAWWQVINADVGSGNNLMTHVLSPNMFGLPGPGSNTFPGVPAYSGSTDLAYSTISNQHWIVQSTSPIPKSINYQTLANLIPADVTINPLVSPAGDAAFSTGGSSYGYTWYKATGDLTINGPLTLGSQKVILLVEGGDLTINAPINLADGSGFFMAIVGKNSAGLKGNIIVGSSVGGSGSPQLEGIYEADGTFNDSIGNTQLWVRGSVVANKGVSLLRDLGGNNVNTPAEIFEYAPDQAILYPSKLGIRKLNWKEVAP